MFQELINKQVNCYSSKDGKPVLDKTALDCLRFMYPNFRVAKNDFDIYPDEPFIYTGEIKWINKINKRPELHIVVASTGEYDLKDKDTLINLAYLHHQKKRPQYLNNDLIKTWSDEQFLYNWKTLWITGDVPDKVIQQNTLFLEILKNFQTPLELVRAYLKATEQMEIKYLESSLISFIQSSNDISDVNTKNKFILNARQSFHNSNASNVPKAVNNLIESPIDNQTLKLYDFLLDLTMRR